MKKSSLIMMIAASSLLFQACNSNRKKDTVATADSANSTMDTSTASTSNSNSAAGNTSSSASNANLDQDAAKFAVKAANGGMAEVALGKLAQEKATNSKVKEFGAMMVSDHSKANNELMTLAQSKNITLPAAVGADEQKKQDDLSKKSGNDFDKAYVDNMIDDHKKDIKEFEDAAKDLKDPDLKAFATKTLPTLKMHLSAIQKIHDSMK